MLSRVDSHGQRQTEEAVYICMCASPKDLISSTFQCDRMDMLCLRGESLDTVLYLLAACGSTSKSASIRIVGTSTSPRARRIRAWLQFPRRQRGFDFCEMKRR